MARLAWVREGLPKAYKTFGLNMPRERYQDGSNTLFNVFLNPAFVNTYKPSPGVQALLGAYEATGKADGLPKTKKKTLTFDGVDYQLTGADVAEFQRRMAGYGTVAFEKTPLDRLRRMSPDEQVRVMRRAFDKGYDDARRWFKKDRLATYRQPKK